MKPRVRVITGIVIAVAVIAAIVAATVCAIMAKSGRKPAEELKPAVFNVGMIAPLTGDAALIGVSAQQGAELAVELINNDGGADGVPLNLIVKNDVGSSANAALAYNELKDEDVSAVIGPLTNTAALGVDNLAEKDKLVRLMPTATVEGCTTADSSFRMCLTDRAQGEAIASYLKQQGVLKAAVLYDKSVEYSSNIDKGFVDKYVALGGYVTANEVYSKGDTDYSNQLKKIKESGANVLVLPVYYTEVEQITKQAAKLGLNVQYIGSDSWYGIIEQLNGNTQYIEGAKFITSIVATDTNPYVKRFVDEYKARYGTEPDNYAAVAYDAVYAVKAAIEASLGTYSSADILKAFNGLTYQGVSGSYTFGEDGEPIVTPKLAGVNNGTYTAEN
jgi:branched-chain amino acid transport system substrate-binding protein